MEPKKYISLIVGICWGISILAQVPHYNLHEVGEPYKNAQITLVYQAKNGFLWFGSNQGLFRYDGFTFKSYQVPDSLSSNEVSAIFEDNNEVLWIGYTDGSIFFSKSFLELQPWQIEEGWPQVAITGFEMDQDHAFWIATYGEGVYCYQNNHLYNINTDDGLLGDDIYSMIKIEETQMWVGTDGGISICEWKDGAKKLQHITRKDGLPDDIIRTILPDKNGNLWIGTYDEGICFYDVNKQRIDHPIKKWSYGPVSALEVFDNKEIWIGTEGKGVFRFNLMDHSIQSLNIQAGRTPSKVHDLLKDQEGNIWILDNLYGIRSANRHFEFVKEELQGVQATLMDNQGRLWLGTQQGLFSLERDDAGTTFFQAYHLGRQLNTISLYEDQFNNLWIGTFGEGLYCIHPQTGRFKHFTENDGLTNSSILSIDGKEDQVWLATLGGVTEVNNSNNILTQHVLSTKNFNLEGALGTNFIYKVFVDSQGRTWFGTDGKGISVLENGVILNYAKADSLPIKSVYSITEDLRGHIWFSTAKEGVYEFDGRYFHPLNANDGLRNLAITSLITDSRGNILIVHPSGIDLLNPVTRHLIYYDEEVGIFDIDPHLNVVCKDPYNNVWIGAKNGVMRYTVLDENLRTYPRIQLNSLSVFLNSIDFNKRSKFTYDENNLIFNYVGLWYTDPESVKYRYILEGFDLDWIESRDQQITYSNLPPGRYALKLTTTGNQVFENQPFIYDFSIRAPLWQQWWFIGILTLTVSVLTFLGIRSRETRIQRETLLKKEKVESQFEALKSQINPHFLFNSFNTLITIIEENPPVAVAYVEKLSDFYRSILQYRTQNVISLKEEIELVNHYAFLLKKRYGENLKLDIQSTDGSDSHFVAPLTLQILVENAIKHNIISKTKPLKIDISVEREDYIVVCNNLQKKLSPERSTGFGLQNIINRYALLSDKKVKIEETAKAFKVGIPIIKNNHL